MEIIKKFLEWVKLKEQVHADEKHPLLFNERDVWMCYFGENVGTESNGKNEFFHRPVLVLHKFNKHLFYGLPLSTKMKDNKFYVPFDFNGKKQSAMISQMRTLDVKRLHYKKGKLSQKDFELIKGEFLKIFQKNNPPKRGSA